MKQDIATTKHDPQLPLGQASRAQFVRVVLGGFSRQEAQRLSSLPVARARTEMDLMMSNLGRTMTREECDACLRDLAIILPRANLDAEDIERMLDLYYGLLSERGIPIRILQNACKTYVMAPRKGKAKWFPDPGELAELCADDLREHRQKMAALQRGIEILDGKQDAPALPGQSRSAPAGSGPLAVPDFDRTDYATKLPSIAEVLAKHGRPDTISAPAPAPRAGDKPARPLPVVPTTPSARTSTDVTELKAALEKKTGRPFEELKQDHPLS